MSNYKFGNINNRDLNIKLASDEIINAQENSSGLVIPQLFFVGSRPNPASIKQKTKSLAKSSILSEYLYKGNTFVKLRQVSAIDDYIKTFFNLSDIYEGFKLLKEYEGDYDLILNNKKLLDVGLFLIKDPYKEKISILSNTNNLFELPRPSYDISVFNNNIENGYVIIIPNMPLALEQTLKVYQPQLNEEKENADINVIKSDLYLDDFLKYNGRNTSVMINDNTTNELKRLGFYKFENGKHQFTLLSPINPSERSVRNDLISLNNVLLEKRVLPNKLINASYINEGRKSFITVNENFSYRYINAIFYLTYYEILKREPNNNAKETYNNYISITLIGMILYALRFNNSNFDDNKILLPKLPSPSEFADRRSPLYLKDNPESIYTSFVNNNFSRTSFDRLVRVDTIPKNSTRFLTRTIYNYKFVKENIKLIIKNITFIRELSPDVMLFDNENNRMTIDSNKIFSPTIKVSPPPTFEDSDFDDAEDDYDEDALSGAELTATPEEPGGYYADEIFEQRNFIAELKRDLAEAQAEEDEAELEFISRLQKEIAEEERILADILKEAGLS